MTWISRIIYALVGICGLYLLSLLEECLPFQTIPNVFKKKSPFVCAVKEELPL